MAKVLLCVCGGIAAYKSCEIARLLVKQGHTVQVAMSGAAQSFIHPNTFHALSGNAPITENSGAMTHIRATREADVMLIAPASANTIAKIAHGIADNLMSNLAAARTIPLAIAPAMNTAMWNNAPNMRNINQLKNDGVHIFMPLEGDLACGENGMGKMQEPDQIVDLLNDFFYPKTLVGQKVLLTAGATFEAIDPVRGITNISSGKMGIALARAARAAGAEVSLIYGQIQVKLPEGLSRYTQVQSALQMHQAVMQQIENKDIFISVAAVADYRVINQSAEKIKKTASTPVLQWTENPDILASVAALPSPPFCVGFAAESEHLEEYAIAKRKRKNIPLLVGNKISDAMGKDENKIILVTENAVQNIAQNRKDKIAQIIIEKISEMVNKK